MTDQRPAEPDEPAPEPVVGVKTHTLTQRLRRELLREVTVTVHPDHGEIL